MVSPLSHAHTHTHVRGGEFQTKALLRKEKKCSKKEILITKTTNLVVLVKFLKKK